MSAEREVDRWDRFSRYSRADIEKARRSTPRGRRRMLLWTWAALTAIYVTPFGFAFVGDERASLTSRLVDAAIPDPFAMMAIVFISGGAIAARKSSLSNDEARALGDELEDQEKRDRAFGRWLWRGGERPPQLK